MHMHGYLGNGGLSFHYSEEVVAKHLGLCSASGSRLARWDVGAVTNAKDVVCCVVWSDFIIIILFLGGKQNQLAKANIQDQENPNNGHKQTNLVI